MKVLFDTSVLVAALVEVHPDHERAFPYFDRAQVGEIEMAVSTHAMAEVYSTLTALPISARITPAQAHETLNKDVRAAEKTSADELLTCNGRDFRRMPPDGPTRLVVV